MVGGSTHAFIVPNELITLVKFNNIFTRLFQISESLQYLKHLFFSSRRRHTRCSRDWSSDVCSSDLDNLIDNEYDGEDMPTIEWNREAPELTEGTIFQSMVDCRNAVTTWCILNENTYKIKRSESVRFTVFCPYDRCRWKLHASRMLKSKLIQVIQVQ